MSVDGAFPCPDCGVSITTWRGLPDGRRFSVDDPCDPYRAHACSAAVVEQRALVAAMREQTAALQAFTEGMAQRRTGQPQMRPQANGAPVYLPPAPASAPPVEESVPAAPQRSLTEMFGFD